MKIAIVGAHLEGKTHVVDNFFFRALVMPEFKDYGFKVYDHGVLSSQRSPKRGKPTLIVGEFTDPLAACAWLKAMTP